MTGIGRFVYLETSREGRPQAPREDPSQELAFFGGQEVDTVFLTNFFSCRFSPHLFRVPEDARRAFLR